MKNNAVDKALRQCFLKELKITCKKSEKCELKQQKSDPTIFYLHILKITSTCISESDKGKEV